MKIKCVKNYSEGFLSGFDYRTKFTVGKIYQFFAFHNTIYVYGDDNAWTDVFNEFEQMFVPGEL